MQFIGIDGGGTGTQAILGTNTNEIIKSVSLGPTNRHSAGDAAVERRIHELLDLLEARENDSLARICFSGAGVDTEADEDFIRQAFQKAGWTGELLVHNDAVGALCGANGQLEGGVLICGTGSIATGVDQAGTLHRVGGWGHLIGDEGSGYAVGITAIREASKVLDGRSQEKALGKQVIEAVREMGAVDLVDFLYGPIGTKDAVASLTPLVIQAAGNGDMTAKRILASQADQIADMVETLGRQIGAEAFQLGLCGSLLTKSDVYRNHVIERLQKRMPLVQPHLPKYEPVMGALLMARGGIK